MIEPPSSVRPLFVAAGWHPGRRVEVPPAVPSDHPAAHVLAAFGGLKVSPDRESGGRMRADGTRVLPIGCRSVGLVAAARR